MGFDNECILNIQSLAGEYFCPVCRTLVYPNEALQTQCTHLYCKPCLTYVVSSTQACPYDGYLVTEAGSKPLIETNKGLAETIGKIAVHCLYHRSGCTWQGPLSECITHCSGCAFGNSPVVCNRCGIQIVHRQVQEHAQTCSVNVGTNPQPQPGPENVQDAATSGAAVSVDQNRSAVHNATPNPPPQAGQTAVVPSAPQNLNNSATANPQQAAPAATVPTPEQWYQQHYQQYYQQYPGYDPYQQAYQQYYPYQQQGTQQLQQPAQGQTQNQVQAQLPVQSQPQFQQQMQPPMQLQPQVQPYTQMQPQPQNLVPSHAQGQTQIPSQPLNQSQSQPPIPSHGQPQQQVYPQAAVSAPNHNLAQSQQQVHSAVQPNVQIQSQSQVPVHGQMPSQSYSQVQTHPIASQYQQSQPQMLHSQPPQVLPHPQAQSQHPPQGHPQFQPHPQLQPPPHPNSQHPPVAGYPQQFHQQIQQAPPPQHTMQVQPSTPSLPPGQVPVQFSQPPPHVRPPQPHLMPSAQGQAPGMQPVQQPVLTVHQRPVMHQVQQSVPQQYVHQTQASAPLQGQIHHPGHFSQQHSQVRPQGPPQLMQQHPLGYVQSHQGTALAHGMPPHSSQSYVGRPAVPLQGGGGQSQQFQSSGAVVIAPHARPPQFGSSQTSVDQSNANTINPPHASSDQQFIPSVQPTGGAVVERKGDQTSERTVEQQEDKSPSLKKSETTNGFGVNVNEAKPEIGKNDEDDSRKDAAVTKDAVSEVQHAQGVSGDPVTIQKVKEEGKDSALDHASVGKSVHNTVVDVRDVTRDSMRPGEGNVNLQGSTDVDKGSLSVPPGNSQGPHSGRDRTQHSHLDRNLNQSQTMSQGQVGDVSGGFQHSAAVTDQGRFQHPSMPYGLPGPEQRPVAPLLQHVPPSGQVPVQHHSHFRPSGHGQLPHLGQASNVGEHFRPSGPTGSFHPEYPLGGPSIPGSASMMGRAPNNFSNQPRTFEPQSAGPQYNQGPVPSSAGHTRMSQAEPVGPPLGSAPPPRGPESQTGPHLPMPMEADMYQNQKPPQFDGRRPDAHVPGNLERGAYAHSFGVESSAVRMNGAPPAGLDSSSAPVFHDEKFKTPSGERTDAFSVGPSRVGDQAELKESAKQFPRPHPLGSEASSGFGNSFPSRPAGAFGVDGPSRPLDKDAHGFSYDAGHRVVPGSVPSGFLPPYQSAGTLHPNESGGRLLSAHDDNRGRLDNNRTNPDYHGPVHGFGRHHMDRLPPGSTGREYVGNQSRLFGISHGNDDLDGRERHSFGGRFPTLSSGHVRRGELDGPVNMRIGEHMRGDDFTGHEIPPSHIRRAELFGPRNLSGRSHVGEPGFGSFQDYGRSGEPNRHGSFSHQQPFGESFGAKSTHPHMGEPGFRSTFSHQAFPNDRGFFAGLPDSFDSLRKRKSLSMGWCRICKVDCESVEGLDIHGQTREHQRMAMDMVTSIKQKTAKKHKSSNDHSVREEPTTTRNVGLQGRGNKP